MFNGTDGFKIVEIRLMFKLLYGNNYENWEIAKRHSCHYDLKMAAISSWNIEEQ